MTTIIDARPPVHLEPGRSSGAWTRRVLLVLDPADAVPTGVDLAILLAQEHGGPLRVLAIARDSTLGFWCAPIASPWSPEQLREAALDDAHRRCTEVVRRVPCDIGTQVSVDHGRLERILRSMLTTGIFGAVVIPGRMTRRRAVRRAARAWSESGIEVHAAWNRTPEQPRSER
jgi:hypothetical protein